MCISLKLFTQYMSGRIVRRNTIITHTNTRIDKHICRLHDAIMRIYWQMKGINSPLLGEFSVACEVMWHLTAGSKKLRIPLTPPFGVFLFLRHIHISPCHYIPNSAIFWDADAGTGCLRFTSLQHLRSYQDGYQNVTVRTNCDFILLPLWEIRPLTPCPDIPVRHAILTLN